jgi:hypothetical protein
VIQPQHVTVILSLSLFQALLLAVVVVVVVEVRQPLAEVVVEVRQPLAEVVAADLIQQMLGIMVAEVVQLLLPQTI